jgi:hypothetical protein
MKEESGVDEVDEVDGVEEVVDEVEDNDEVPDAVAEVEVGLVVGLLFTDVLTIVPEEVVVVLVEVPAPEFVVENPFTVDDP